MNEELKKQAKELIIISLLLGVVMFGILAITTANFKIYAESEEIYSEWDAESETYSNEQTKEETNEEIETEGQIYTDNTNTTTETTITTTDAEIITTKIEELDEKINTLSSKFTGPVKAPANVINSIGLTRDLPRYIYSIKEVSGQSEGITAQPGRIWYFGTNSAGLYLSSSNFNCENQGVCTPINIYNAYIDGNGGQQLFTLFETEKQAESTLWGWTTISSTSVNAWIHAGAVRTNKTPWEYPYTFGYIKKSAFDSGETDATQSGRIYAGYMNNENGPSPGTAEIVLDIRTLELVKEITPTEEQALQIGDIYLIGGTIICLILWAELRRTAKK